MKMIAFAALMAASGCALFAKGSSFPADLQTIENCVYTQVVTDGNSDPAAIIAACGPDAAVAVIDAIQILIDGKKVSAERAQLLTSNVGKYKAAHAAP